MVSVYFINLEKQVILQLFFIWVSSDRLASNKYLLLRKLLNSFLKLFVSSLHTIFNTIVKLFLIFMMIRM